ncbi:MAG: ABC transporter permease subunit [Oscillospiraceae bacterium]
MRKLLSANFTRLWRNKVFWLCVLFSVGAAVVTAVGAHRVIVRHPGIEITLESNLFQIAAMVGFAQAVFCGLFLGTEYSDGTVRNKLVVGHTRAAVYNANLIVCMAAGLVMSLAYFVVYLPLGWALIGAPTTATKPLTGLIALTLLMTLSFSAIFTLIGMLNQNKAGAAVTALLLVLATMFLCSYLLAQLNEQETTMAGQMLSDGTVVLPDPEPNPDYVSGTKRVIYQFIVDFLPIGQGMQISNAEVTNPWRMGIYSAVIVVLSALLGTSSFRRKDIK